MARIQRSVCVNGFSYLVVERSGYLKACLNSEFGWTSVWADTYTNLTRRIKQALRGGQ